MILQKMSLRNIGIYERANSNLIYFYPNSSNNSLAADMSYEEMQLSASLVANAHLLLIVCQLCF